jgi:hypothetical protein
MLWRPVNVEVALAAIEPRQGVAGAVEFQEFEFVGRCGEVVARRDVVVISPLPLALDTLRLDQTVNFPVQFKLMGGLILHGSFQCRDLVL